jgi:hypothetical protein
MALRAKLLLGLDVLYDGANGVGSISFPIQSSYGTSFSQGTGAGQADRLYQARRTIAASGTDDLDLAGTLTDVLGQTLTFVKIKAIMVSAAAGNTNNVVLGGAASNGFTTWTGAATDKVVIRPGGTFALIAGQGDAAGYAVTATTGDLLRVANSGAGSTVTYDIVVVGTSA